MGLALELFSKKDGLLPVEIQLPVRCRAVSKVQIDEALIRNANVFRNGLEIRDGRFIKPNGDLLLELGHIGILSCNGEVVLSAHGAPLRIKPRFLGRCLASRSEANDVASISVSIRSQNFMVAQQAQIDLRGNHGTTHGHGDRATHRHWVFATPFSLHQLQWLQGQIRGLALLLERRNRLIEVEDAVLAAVFKKLECFTDGIHERAVWQRDAHHREAKLTALLVRHFPSGVEMANDDFADVAADYEGRFAHVIESQTL